MSNEDKFFNNPRVNEYNSRFLGISAINPWLNNISSPRVQMVNSQLQQILPVKDATDKRTFTGVESQFGRYTFSKTAPEDCEVLKLIPRYPPKVGDKRDNPETLAIIEYDEQLSDGSLVKTIDCIEMHSHQFMHHTFGRPYNYHYTDKNFPGTLEKGEPIASSQSISETGSYRFGLEANIAMMSVPQVTEDGVVASKSFCERMRTTGMQSFVFSFGKKEFPLNLYGDEQNYKFIPDIGERVDEKGILAALRRYSNSSQIACAPVDMSVSNVRKIDHLYDRCVYATPNARVVDVRVQHDCRYRTGVSKSSRSRSVPQTPTHIAEQAYKYWSQEVDFYQELLEYYQRLKKSNPGIRLSRRLHRYIVEAQAMAAVNTRSELRIKYNYLWEPIDEWRVEVMVEYDVVPTIGFKLSALHGDKSVIVDVVDDEDMPVDDAGNRAELIVDGLSTIKRMNISRVYEQYINACSRDVTLKLQQMWSNGADYKSLSDYLSGYYQIVTPRMLDLVSDGELVYKEHLDHVLENGIYLWVPNDNEPEIADIIKQLNEHYPPVFTPVQYRDTGGNWVRTVTPILIGSMYIILLEKTGQNWQAVSTSKLNHIGIPSKINNVDRNLVPVRTNPVRFGESENRLFLATLGGRATASLLDSSNNPQIRKQIAESILRANKPADIDQVYDRDRYPLGSGRTQSLVKHLSHCAGFKYKYSNE